jgi:hypothetical protein
MQQFSLWQYEIVTLNVQVFKFFAFLVTEIVNVVVASTAKFYSAFLP